MDQDIPLEPTEVLEKPLEEPPIKRRPAWFKETLHEAERRATPSGIFRESKRPQRYVGYVALVSIISDAESSLFEETNKLQVWKDAMLDEYKSIMKNCVWGIVPRPKDKSVVSSKWPYKIKHATFCYHLKLHLTGPMVDPQENEQFLAQIFKGQKFSRPFQPFFGISTPLGEL